MALEERRVAAAIRYKKCAQIFVAGLNKRPIRYTKSYTVSCEHGLNGLTNIKDCLVTEINVANEKHFFACLYRSPSQSHDELN